MGRDVWVDHRRDHHNRDGDAGESGIVGDTKAPADEYGHRDGGAHSDGVEGKDGEVECRRNGPDQCSHDSEKGGLPRVFAVGLKNNEGRDHRPQSADVGRFPKEGDVEIVAPVECSQAGDKSPDSEAKGAMLILVADHGVST